MTRAYDARHAIAEELFVQEDIRRLEVERVREALVAACGQRGRIRFQRHPYGILIRASAVVR